MTPTVQSADRAAFERYLDIVNRALVAVRSQFPYGTVIGALQLELDRRPFVVSIHGEAPEDATRVGCILAELEFRWIPTVPDDPAARWPLDRAHMMAVLEAPWRYVASPSRIELPPFSLIGPQRGGNDDHLDKLPPKPADPRAARGTPDRARSIKTPNRGPRADP